MKPESSAEPDFYLPTGTVTFLLADVEGSVRRWEEDQAIMARDMVRFHEIVGETIGRREGVRPEEQGGGDSFVGAFAQATDAALCAIDIQNGFRAELPDVRLRIALHTGEAQRRDAANYFGRAINRCGRLRDLAHGGQILLSRATCDLVVDRLPEAAWVKDLGTHRLRDLARPEHVFQLCHSDLPEEFPPLRSLDVYPNNLPARLTSFVGREQEIAEVDRLLNDSRMVTLTGSGGCGKTRLALQVAAERLEEYPDGVWWVDLAPVADPSLVPSAAAAALSLREVPMRPLIDTITNELRDRRALIILDNCEHLVDACAALAGTVLSACPQVSVLATSRHTIDVEGEISFRVPSLRLPKEGEPQPVEVLGQYEAVRLFVDRAVNARPNFRVTNENAPAVAHICHRLDGIPLAIELAAARVRVLSVDRISEELGDVFHVLTGGARTAVPRHQTLRASVEWSYGLLTEDERALLRRLSVFAGGFTLDAAEEVGSGDGLDPELILDLLSGLVDKSLVQVEESGPEIRYRLLETIRQYGAAKAVEAGEAATVRTRHLDFYTALAERAEPELEGEDMLEWIRTLRLEHDNIRAALDWSLSSGQPETGLRLAGAVSIFWFVGGFWSEARQRYGALLAEEISDGAVRANGLLGASTNTLQLLDIVGAYGFAEEALVIARETGHPGAITRALSLMGTAKMWLGDFETARPLLEESIDVAARIGDHAALARAYFGLANGEWIDAGDIVRARSYFEMGLEAARAAGSPFRIGYMLALFGIVCGWRGELDRAETYGEEALQLLGPLGEPAFRSMATGGLAWVRLLRGEYERASSDAEDAVSLAAEGAHVGALSWGRFLLAWLHRATGDLEAAEAELEQAANLGRAMNIPGWAGFFLIESARLSSERDKLDGTEALLEEAVGFLGEPRGFLRGLIADARARLARERGELEEAERLAHEALPLLVGAAETARDDLGYVRFPSQKGRYEEDVALARSGLDDEGFEKAWAEGAAMSLEEAVAYAQRGRGERKRPSHGWASLTPVELEVAKLVAERLTNPQIAERLFVSRGTIKTHLSHIYTKLGVSSRLELADEVARRSS